MIYLITLLVICLDQLSKRLALDITNWNQVIPVFPSFNLVLVLNKGISWSFFASDWAGAQWVLIVVALVISLMMVWWMAYEDSPVVRGALALIIGGAIGNMIDRVRWGGVVDFLDFYYGAYHWPAFNIADSAITLGVLLLVFNMILGGKKR